jgi:mRNA-degrading endonuclease RelE of RelBE toxin-antitoxin system
MARVYWTSEASGQLAELDPHSQQAIRRRVDILADFPFAGVALKREWEGFRKLSAAPLPWVIIYTVRDADTVIIGYLRHARSRWESR